MLPWDPLYNLRLCTVSSSIYIRKAYFSTPCIFLVILLAPITSCESSSMNMSNNLLKLNTDLTLTRLLNTSHSSTTLFQIQFLLIFFSILTRYLWSYPDHWPWKSYFCHPCFIPYTAYRPLPDPIFAYVSLKGMQILKASLSSHKQYFSAMQGVSVLIELRRWQVEALYGRWTSNFPLE